MNNEANINRIVDLAYKHSTNGGYNESAICFYKAAMIADCDLKDHLLCKKYLYYSHVEQLKQSQGKSIPDIDSIINLLREMSSCEDDRLPDRLTPIIDFFTILKFCLNDEVAKVQATLEKIRNRTEGESVSQIQSVTHLLCESALVKEVLKAFGSKVNECLADVFSSLSSLEDCIDRHRTNSHLSGVVRTIFDNYHKCIQSIRASNVALIISKCINPTVGKIISNDVLNIITEDIKEMIGLKMIERIEKQTETKDRPAWITKAGYVCGVTTLAFFMFLVVASLLGHNIAKTERWSVIIVLSLGVGLSFSFLGGNALAEGKILMPFAKRSPLVFALSKGAAFFIITFVIGYLLLCE